ncbi:MAG TPA: membrane protein insertase YidC [Pseudonocardiaceae bacterium]|nr:membrane protein insertase YidC [Pseudonocardiaceae bacterium]
MFDFIYYIVSFILWCWHWVFGHILGDSNAIGWALSIIFLVFTLRAILLKPAIAQVRSMRKMQQFAPEMKKLQKKYANDRQRQAQEMQKLQREHGVNPLGGCLPMVLQIPVFLGLNHVLRSFRPGTTEVYYFKSHDVQSYLDAKLFGAHLGDALFGIGSLGGSPGWHWGVAPVAIPLMVLASIATHFTARLSVQRQEAMGTPATGQAAMMGKLTMWVFPLGVLVFGGGFPVGLLLYWLSNNGWTLGQQHFVMTRMDREEAEKKAAAQEARANLGPKPGQKPARPKTGTTSPGTGTTESAPASSAATTSSTAPKPGQKPAAKPGTRTTAADSAGSGTGKTTGAKPAAAGKPGTAGKPGAKSAQNKTNPAKPGAKNGNSAPSQSANTNGGAQDSGDGGSEIPGLISDRSRRKKQDRKRG